MSEEKQPLEQVISLRIGDIDFTIRIDLSALPVGTMSLPVRISTDTANKATIRYPYIPYDSPSPALKTGAREPASPDVLPLALHSICEIYNELCFGQMHPTLMIVGEHIAKLLKYGHVFQDARVFRARSMSVGLVIFINEHDPSNPKYSRIVELFKENPYGPK